MISSNLGAGYALVPVPPVPDWNVSAGGGPIRKSSGIALPAHAGTFVQRSPLNVVREAEAGSTWPQDLATTMMFLDDGRLVPQAPYARPFGDSGPQPIFVQPHRSVKPAFISMLLGAGAGGALVSKHRIGGAIGGALVGGVLGLIFG